MTLTPKAEAAVRALASECVKGFDEGCEHSLMPDDDGGQMPTSQEFNCDVCMTNRIAKALRSAIREAVEEEREACALIALGTIRTEPRMDGSIVYRNPSSARDLRDCAAAIRARREESR